MNTMTCCNEQYRRRSIGLKCHIKEVRCKITRIFTCTIKKDAKRANEGHFYVKLHSADVTRYPMDWRHRPIVAPL